MDDPAGNSHAPRIFVTVGTDHHPFDRLVRWVDGWCSRAASSGAQVLVQTGTSHAPNVAAGIPFLPRDELDRTIAEALAVVCHGGPGTIIGCLDAGKKPIVVPRTRALGEHVDDHQVRFSRRLHELGYIHLAEDEPTFIELLDSAIAGSPAFTAVPAPDRVGPSASAFARIIGDRLGIFPPDDPSG